MEFCDRKRRKDTSVTGHWLILKDTLNWKYWSVQISCQPVAGRYTNVAVIKSDIMEYTYNSTICKNGLVYTQNIEKRVC